MLVTGGTGFLGSALVKRLVASGHHVRVLDNNLRGHPRRLLGLESKIEIVEGDVRSASDVERACSNIDQVCHLAYVNGTEFFYTHPDLVLEIAVKGMLNVIEACRKYGIRDLVLASSSEVYQSPSEVPTPENVPLVVPDPMNSRYSYGGGKIISELMALHMGRDVFDRVMIFRPHNVYGPDMGWEHVVPQFCVRLKALLESSPQKHVVDFPIQGSGLETRSFIYIDDFTDGLMKAINGGTGFEIFHIGTQVEVSIREVAQQLAKFHNIELNFISSALTLGSTPRRCPSISKLQALGFEPQVSFANGLMQTMQWYWKNSHLQLEAKNINLIKGSSTHEHKSINA